MDTGNDRKAIDILRQRLHDSPNDASLLYLLGESLLRSGVPADSPEYHEAQTALENAVRLNPALCLSHVSLGSIYLDEGRYADAVIELKRAKEIDPTEHSVYSHLAVAYRRSGNMQAAKDVLNELQERMTRERQTTRDRMKAQTDQAESQTSHTP